MIELVYVRKSQLVRSVYFALAWLFFLTGLLGVVLPVLPTTPFMLLALWAFSRSSERFHNWLYNHRLFGPPLQKWTQYRVIPLSAKIMAVSVMTVSLTYMLIYSASPTYVKVITCLLMSYGMFFVLSKPSQPPVQTDSVS